MELKDVKVGQRVFVKRESTAILSDTLAGALGETMKMLARLMGMNIVDICKEKDGFYVANIFNNGNVSLGEKQEDGSINACWGIFNPSDFELAEEEKNTGRIDVLDIVLKELLEILRDLKKLDNEPQQTNKKSTKSRGRGRPKGSPNKKHKGE